MTIENHYFISYSHQDLDIAKRLKEDLKKSGFQIWLDEKIEPGMDWRDSVEKNIKQSIAVLYLASPTSRTSRYVRHELDYAEIYKKNVIPLWIRGNTEWAKVVVFGFSSAQYTDLREKIYNTGIKKLIQRLKNMTYLEDDVESIINLPPPNQMLSKEREMSQRNPYKGLHAFEYKDAQDFFGRESLVSEMVRQVKNILSAEKSDSQVPRCMMVVGASGSGKSSVVMAGLLPTLEGKKDIAEVDRWFFLAPVRPGDYPMNALVQMLQSPFLNESNAGSSPIERWRRAALRKTLGEQNSRGLIKLLQEITDRPNDRIVLIIDQFEEIFAPSVDADQREQFINLLVATATEPDTPVLLLFTLRADFYHRILDNDAFYQMVKQSLIDIPPMTREELRAVIEKPVQHPDVNVTFDPYLAEDLLYEVLKRPASLPLLQFTLEQLFELRDRKERRLTRQSYDKIGGLQGAINEHAEDTYNHELHTPQHRAEARKLFTEQFIYISEAYDEPSRLESGEEITRRRVTKADLHLNELTIRREIIEAFVNARLLTATSTVRQSTKNLENVTDTTYEISHEALINAWKRLREWIKEDRKDIYLIQSLRPRIRQWDQEENQRRKKELLVEKLPLQQLQEYGSRKTPGPLMDEFLQASLARQRNRRILASLFIGVTALVILLLVLGIIFRNVVFPSAPDPTIVTSVADSGPGSLSYALQMASDGATITFDASLKGKTISLTHSGLDINKSITLRGPVSISSPATGNYIHIEPNKNVLIENMTFANSYTQKNPMIQNDGNLTINNSILSKNKSYGYGGVIFNTEGGNLVLNSDILENSIVTTNGGAIYNLFGTVSINNSHINGNEAYGNGGGIYSQGGALTVSESYIWDNSADGNAGGGIDMVNGVLSVSDTQIDHNHSDYVSGGISTGYGGGIAIVGSVAFINSSVITANTASAKGGGIAVTDDTDNNSSSLVKLQDIIPTNNPNAVHYIGQNTGGDIAGNVTTTGTTLQIFDDRSIDSLWVPPNSNPPQKLPNYLGVANINTFCLSKGGSYGKISTNVDRTAPDIMFTCFNQKNKPVGPDFPGQAICAQYSNIPENTVIDHMANYYDPTSLQCYKNLKRLGPIGQVGFANYCASRQPQYTGLFDNSQYRHTAYDWLCQPKDNSKLPSGLSVADACSLQYGVKDAVDRLFNFNSIDGWECWEPA